MRFKTAVALMLLGLLTLLAGIGQKTFWAPAETFTASAPADATAAPLTVFDQKLRTVHGGTVKINVKGEGSFLLAVGRPDDVGAWVGKTAHNTVSGISEDRKALQLTHTDGEAAAPSPAGSDLWVAEENGSGELSYSWTAPADGDWSLLLAADGTKPAPASITMTFPNDTSTPWAVPFMVVGALLILAGAALVFLKPRAGGPAGAGGSTAKGPGGAADVAPPAGPGRAERNAAGGHAPAGRSALAARPRAVAMAGALALAAVAASGLPAQAGQTPPPAPGTSATDQAPGIPVLLDAQFRRILEQVAAAVEAGDAAKDAGKLEPRVAKTELEVRTQNYKIRSQVASHPARIPVRATKLRTAAVPTQRGWPRTVLAVTEGEGNVTQLLTLSQASARENYKLIDTSPMQPGTVLSGFARDGAEMLAPSDKSGLPYSGEEALAALGDRLTFADSVFKDKLVEGESSPYIADTLDYQADLVSGGPNATFSFTHKPVPENTLVFRTADGGALVLGRLDFSVDGTPKAAGDTVQIGDDAAALAGSKETETGMVLVFAESVAVYVPPAGSADPMKMVAATRGLVKASFK